MTRLLLFVVFVLGLVVGLLMTPILYPVTRGLAWVWHLATRHRLASDQRDPVSYKIHREIRVYKLRKFFGLPIRTARINTDLRDTLERYGVNAVQWALASTNTILHHGQQLRFEGETLESVLQWLSEQHDRAERRETWSLRMEMAITLFVAAELFLSAISFVRTRP